MTSTNPDVQGAVDIMAPLFWQDLQPDFVPTAPQEYTDLRDDEQKMLRSVLEPLAQALADEGLLINTNSHRKGDTA